MPDGQRLVMDTPFSVIWQLPGYPGAALVSCGANIAALHCWQRAVNKVLIYGKAELIACYEDTTDGDKLYFATTTRYVDHTIDLKRGLLPVEAALVSAPECEILDIRGQNQVQVKGIVRIITLGTPGVKGEPDSIRLPKLVKEPLVQELPEVAANKKPLFPRGAENLPPVVWSMPERG